MENSMGMGSPNTSFCLVGLLLSVGVLGKAGSLLLCSHLWVFDLQQSCSRAASQSDGRSWISGECRKLRV